MFPADIPEFFKLMNQDPTIYDFVTKPTYHYCLSKENHEHCVRYNLWRERKEPPPGLSPDGQMIDIANSTLKKKIIFEQTS